MLLNFLSFMCVITTLPGPPGFFLENNAYFAIYPINKIICPEIDKSRDIIFILFTKQNPNTSEILILNNDTTIENSKFDFTKNTVFYFHGFLEGVNYGSAKYVKEGYLKEKDINLVLVDAQRLTAGPWYLTASQNTKVIGKYSAEFIDYLVTKGLNLNKTHLIGHSLGSHSAGVCGNNIKSGKVSRITGLDPAKPLFENVSNDLRLDKSDAEFVDIIHTNTKQFGLTEPLGHADFYPNGGVTQPGCCFDDVIKRNPTSILEIIFCSHWQSFKYYTESINNPKSFISMQANSWDDYLVKKYNISSKTHLGLYASNTARGTFYLSTNSNPPYSLS